MLFVPDNLVDEVVGVLGGEHGERGARRHSLLEADHLGVDGEDGRLVHVLDGDGDAGRRLEGGLDTAGQVGLVGHHHGQHEGAIHLEINRLERKPMEQEMQGEMGDKKKKNKAADCENRLRLCSSFGEDV